MNSADDKKSFIVYIFICLIAVARISSDFVINFHLHRYIQFHPVSQCLFVLSTMHIGRTMTWKRKNKWKNGNQLTGILSHGVFIFLIDAGVDDDFLLFIFVLWAGSSLILLTFFFLEWNPFYITTSKIKSYKKESTIHQSIDNWSMYVVRTLLWNFFSFCSISSWAPLKRHKWKKTNVRDKINNRNEHESYNIFQITPGKNFKTLKIMEIEFLRPSISRSTDGVGIFTFSSSLSLSLFFFV